MRIRFEAFHVLVSLCVMLAWPDHAVAQPAIAQASTTDTAQAAPDGQHDFDWEIGRWKTHVRRLAAPLSGSREWVEYEGTSVVREVLGGRANLVELDVRGAAGEIVGTSLRLYNPTTRQWSLHYASLRSGTLTQPVTGGFRDGRGEFHGIEDLDGRPVFVRFVITTTGAAARFEQAYSIDGGRTWETNWIATDTRMP